MPHKGFFTQGVVILLRAPVTIAAVRARLADFPVVKELPGASWEMGGPGLVVAYRRELNGAVTVDVVDRPWPDAMGDPKQEPMVFGAWSMGHFGPCTWPGGLQRAVQQAWAWPEARQGGVPHAGFVRLRVTYVGGADAPVMPEGCDARHELEYLTRMGQALLGLPEALCWFVPGGELLLPAAKLKAQVEWAAEHDVPAVDAWTNARLYNLPDGWQLMDTVGNGQLDVPELEAVFPADFAEPGDVAAFLRNATAYLVERGPIIEDGNTMDGPGEVRWRAFEFEESVADPPRAVLRWFPEPALARVPEPLGPAARKKH